MSQNVDKKIKYVVGVDEVGRGPIAGPVAVCAFVIPIEGSRTSLTSSFTFVIKDSKKLSAKRREKIVEEILQLRSGQVEYKIAFVSNKTIDKIGIVKAIKLAIEETLKKLNPEECKILLDGGLKAPDKFKNQKTIIRGDESEEIISLASIVAKVSRDKKMCEYAKKYPEYGFEKHKGYGTKLHFQNIKKYGLCDLHRKTFLKDYI